MQWFRHYSNSDSHPVLSRIKNDLGPKEYGQFWFICEHLSSVMELDTSEPEITLSEKTWVRNLYCNDKLELNKLLDDLKSVGAILWNSVNGEIKITSPVIRELADKRSISSNKRNSGSQKGPSNDPRVDIDKEIEQNKSDLKVDNKITENIKDQIIQYSDTENKTEETPKVPLFKKRVYNAVTT